MLENSVVSSKASVIAAPGSNPGVSLDAELISLRAGFGQDEANYGVTRYSVDGNGLIQVPLEAVVPLTTIGGFVLARTPDNPISVGLVAVHHDDAAGCSYAGRQYLGDSNGDMLVPAEALSELLAHGFVPVFDRTMVASNRARSAPSNRSTKG